MPQRSIFVIILYISHFVDYTENLPAESILSPGKPSALILFLAQSTVIHAMQFQKIFKNYPADSVVTVVNSASKSAGCFSIYAEEYAPPTPANKSFSEESL